MLPDEHVSEINGRYRDMGTEECVYTRFVSHAGALNALTFDMRAPGAKSKSKSMSKSKSSIAVSIRLAKGNTGKWQPLQEALNHYVPFKNPTT